QLMEGLAVYHTNKLSFATFPQGLFAQILTRLAEAGQSAHLWGIPCEKFGIPVEEITEVIDVELYLDQKLKALRCHQTQLDASHALTLITPELAAELLRFEYFRSDESVA
ncbi:MAG: hypothetical protein M3X11_09930, partial [Acidobacteriota bacterium]|nr:hypothetical protein [Acidobacteriota bacterium]